MGDSVSTHSRPKAAGCAADPPCGIAVKFQLTAARRRLVLPFDLHLCEMPFQLTAARRRLAITAFLIITICVRFNSQPPEGGWLLG